MKMKKKNKGKRMAVLTVLALSMLLVTGAAAVYAAGDIALKVDGKQIQIPAEEAAPINKEGRILVPLRAVFEGAGGKVQWDEGKPSDIAVEYAGSTVTLKVGSKTAYVNGKETTLDVPAQLVNNRTLIPVRFVAESLNFKVRWDGNANTVSLYTPGKEVPMGTVTELSAAANGSKFRVTITAEQSLKNYAKGSLGAPARFYVDLQDFNLGSGAAGVAVSDTSSVVTNVRGGFDQNTDTTRIVMDLKEDSTPTISFSGDGRSMYLDFNKTAFDPMADGKLVVMLDPGHGASTGGKRSPDQTLMEYEFNRDIANRMKPILEVAGIEVLFTVSDNSDPSLQNRCDAANRSNADIFVSTHANAFGNGSDWTSPKGWEIYVYKKGGVAETLAKSIQSATTANVNLINRGLKEADFYVIKYTDIPAVLIEHGFYTNADEVQLLKSPEFRQQLAAADAAGIINFFQAYK